MGSFTKKLSRIMEETIKENGTEKAAAEIAYLSGRLGGKPEITLIGEPVMMGSLAAAIEETYKKPVRVLCPLSETDGLLSEKDEKVRGEEAMEEKLKHAGIIVADPLYRPICPKDCQFYELPHIAFSGRIYLKKLPAFADLCK